MDGSDRPETEESFKPPDTTDMAKVRKNGRRERSGRTDEGRSARQRPQANAEPTFRNPSAEPEPSGEGEAIRDPIGTAVPIGERNRQTGKEQRCSGTRAGEGESQAQVRRKPDRNRPGPQGLGRTRDGDPPEQQCESGAPERDWKEAARPTKDPDPPSGTRPCQPGTALNRGKVGAGGDTGPHYFLGHARVNRRARA